MLNKLPHRVSCTAKSFLRQHTCFSKSMIFSGFIWNKTFKCRKKLGNSSFLFKGNKNGKLTNMNLPCAENVQDNYFSYSFTNCHLILTEISITYIYYYIYYYLPRTINSTWMTDLGEDKGKFKPSKFIKFLSFFQISFKSVQWTDYKLQECFCIPLLWFSSTLTILSMHVSN